MMLPEPPTVFWEILVFIYFILGEKQRRTNPPKARMSVLGGTPVPVPLCSPQILHEITG